MDPLKIVGFEGVFGSVMMIGVMMPIAYFLPGGGGTCGAGPGRRR
jgi:hypothetical protein